MQYYFATKYRHLKQYFGYDSFLGKQEAIIDEVLKQNNCLAILPTGFGKSLCYQLPALSLSGTVIVISPLIALMQDQVNSLTSKGIKAASINSFLAKEELAEIEKRYINQELKLLYVAPERLVNPMFLAFLTKGKPSLFAIDEAHCISTWGDDFRPEYKELKKIAEIFPDIPKLALTATADSECQKDILNSLSIANAKIIKSSLYRKNISYEIYQKKNTKALIENFLKEEPKQAGIIYCHSRKTVESLYKHLLGLGFKVTYYHAGLDYEKREANQNKFFNNEALIMVATIAFGLGINKLDIRFIIHYDLPKSLDAYYQETGRAGRDNKPARAILFYGLTDALRLAQKIDEKDKLKFLAMLDYCSTVACLPKKLLSYFSEEISPCQTCQNCLTKRLKLDLTQEARLLLSAIYRTGQSFGINYIIDVLMAKETNNILLNAHNNLSVFGLGKAYSEDFFRSLAFQLLKEGLIYVNSKAVLSLGISKRAKSLILGESKLYLSSLETKNFFEIKPSLVI